MTEHDYYEINEIKEGFFKYVLSIGPIDCFHYSLTLQQAINNLLDDQEYINFPKEINRIAVSYNFVHDYVSELEEAPHTIRFLSIPREDSNDLDLVVISKISNNGTCFLFSDDRNYLEWINRSQ